ncbi:hypothetical protein CRE_04496 [Caenorhabditis remanei]|uniref:Uncharacterized protein n=1 Tax=Caenorhabditis remanei TaxID=31234 RepID=E3LYP6_CAERE|nr:hypothetical protein CRE_04496 [Caenorhabditis remanei]
MSIITQDALKSVTEQLSPTSRLNLAAIDQQFFSVSTKWHDVKTILFDEDEVTMAGANFVHTFENLAFRKNGVDGNRSFYKADAKETALKLCPGRKKLIIQTKLSDYDAVMLNKMNLKLTKLYISTENLSLVNFPKFEKLKTLHLVFNSTKELKVVDVVEQRVLKTVFPQTLTRICLTGIYLTENLLTHMATLNNLSCLDTIGCLIDTRVGAKYIPLLETYPSLDELSLPPSLFSFSIKTKTQTELSFQKLTVTKIGLYMDQFDDDVFYSQCRHFLPKNLKVLVVFGNYLPLKKWKLLSSINNFMILFGPNISLASCPQANLTNVKLLSHLVRSPPYIQLERNPNFLRNHDMSVGNLEWQFSLIEWKDHNLCRKEVLALRKQMNATGEEEVVFEGVRIPAPVIMQRLGQFRGRRMMMPHSPNDFQVFDGPIPMAPPLPARHPIVHPPRHPQNILHTVQPQHRRRSNRNRPDTPVPRRASRRRTRSAPPAIEDVPRQQPRQSDSMRTHPPSPPVGTQTGAVFNATLPNISPIRTTTASDVTRASASVSTATNGMSVLNRGFMATPNSDTSNTATVGSRRLSTESQVSSVLPSEMTVQSVSTASPERISQIRGNESQMTPPPPANQQNQPPSS